MGTDELAEAFRVDYKLPAIAGWRILGYGFCHGYGSVFFTRGSLAFRHMDDNTTYDRTTALAFTPRQYLFLFFSRYPQLSTADPSATSWWELRVLLRSAYHRYSNQISIETSGLHACVLRHATFLNSSLCQTSHRAFQVDLRCLILLIELLKSV